MKNTRLYTIQYIVLAVLWCTQSRAQLTMEGYDSIIVRKPSTAKLRYEVDHQMFQEISIKPGKPEADKRAAGSIGGFFGRTTMAKLLGNWNSSRETNIRIPSEIRTAPEGYGWNLDTYVDGELERNTERVRNSDGSRSTQTTKTLHINWGKGAWGYIIDSRDTIGAFALSLNPSRDSVLSDAYNKIKDSLPDKDVRRSLFVNYNLSDRDYGLFGNFKESPFYILYFKEEHLGYIYMNGRLDAIVVTDNEQPGVIMMMSKKKRVQPKLLVRQGLTENQRADMIRMALLCRAFAQATAVDSYEY
jgi:hypothetical protein